MLNHSEIGQLKAELETIRRRVPMDVAEALDRYVTEGPMILGHFLTAVVEGDLRGAVARADLANRRALADIVIFCEHFLLPGTWGSPEAVARHEASTCKRMAG